MKKLLSLCLSVVTTLTMIILLPVAASAATGWDGTTAVQPSGNGSEATPYLIAGAENLLWMSQQIGDGTVTDGNVSNPFEGKYFKQTADIDLNGKTLPSIGYYYINGGKMGKLSQGAPVKQADGTYTDLDGKATNSYGQLLGEDGKVTVYTGAYVFGGTYDGQNFKIFNGTVQEPTGAHEFDSAYGSGLFGVIYGATIQNVKLEGITATGISVVGSVVGKAAAVIATDATEKDTSDAQFNRILNCTTDAACSVQATYVSTSNNYEQAGRIGGIVGMAYGTTIRYCVNHAAINGIGNINFAGGIAGTVGYGVVINQCVNHGTLTLDATQNANKAESGYGGIVGFLFPYSSSGSEGKGIIGGVSISYCYNTGSFTFKGLSSSNATCWGGILGGANSLTNGAVFEINYCINLNPENTGLTTDTNFRIGGLIGCYWIPAGADVGYIALNNSFSVKLIAGGNTSAYQGTNEYRCWLRTTKENYLCITDDEATGTRTEAELLPMTAKIDKSIAALGADPDMSEKEEEQNTEEQTEAKTEQNTEAKTEAKTEVITRKEESTTSSKSGTEAGGCQSAVNLGVIGLLSVIALTGATVRKKKD